MCYQIDSEVVIANFFAECEDKTELDLATLAKIKEKLEDEFINEDKYLIVDTSRQSILRTIYTNPKYFSFDESRSVIIFNNSRMNIFYEDIYSIFNSKIDKRIKFQFLTRLEKIMENLTETISR